MSSTRNFINISNKYDRVILLIDMDCFYCQVEEKLDPSLAGKPIAVVQYNPWRGGGIIAVNYAARAKGVTRHMRGDEAKEQCPEIELVKVPNVREKADLSKYRDAGKDVANVLQKFTNLLERASVDEAYLDITAEVNKRMENMNAGTFFLQPEILVNTFAVGYENIGLYISEITSKISNPCDDDEFSLSYDVDDTPAVRKSDLRLLIGAAICSEIRAAVKRETSFECSAGIAHNKILAKLGCGMNKPNKQTILPLSQISSLFVNLPVGKIKGLGGKFGFDVCERLKVKYLGELLNFSEVELQRKLDGKNGSWLYLMCRGIDLEAVTPRFYSKSIGCCKKFPGRNSITGLKTLEHWLGELSKEIADRLEKDFDENNRRAKQMVVGYVQEINTEDISSSRSVPLSAYDPESIQKVALEVLKRNTDQFFKPGNDLALNNAIKFLSISVGKFESNNGCNEQNTLQQMFAKQKKKEPTVSCPSVGEQNDPSSDLEPRITLKDEQNRQGPVSKTTALERMFANQKAKPPRPQESSTNSDNDKTLLNEIPPTKPRTTPTSFFAAHLNKIKQQKLIESQKATTIISEEDNNLFCDEALPTSEENSVSAQGEEEAQSASFFAGAAQIHGSPTKAPSTSFFARAIKSVSPAAVIESSPIKQDPPSTSFFARAIKSVSPKAKPEANPKTLKRKPDSPEISSTNETTSTYQTEYAELATPELRDEFYIKCETCGKKILSDEESIQSHQDHHLAEELSRQQREEYRKEVQTKISQSASQKKSKTPTVNPNAAKKAKPNSPKVGASIESIMKFMQPLTQPDDIPSTSAQVSCDKCGKAMHRDLMPEHLDYHYAKELQVSLNRSDMVKVVVGGGPALNKSIKSPGVPKKTSSSAVAANKSKPITQFFSQL
ncbi:DNA polymerase eta [Eupeodes corollae]|uniref:DNA polymerase eta n=1 Tax=Eupeodes corollae TaxID=290404 RepID=UPI002491C07E|nr:DNA polymerase eta [Eupeodes corollae]